LGAGWFSVVLWATHQGAELDLLLFKKGRRIGVECKRADAPVLTPSMRLAPADLKLDELCVVYPGAKRHTLARNEREVGESLQAELATGAIAREDVFITTKLWNTKQHLRNSGRCR
jgi:hypothetical protein